MKPGSILAATVPAVMLCACATTARMHSVTQLNDVAVRCGLALGELIQDESEKKLLLSIRQAPTTEQRACVTQYAKRNGLKPVFVAMSFES